MPSIRDALAHLDDALDALTIRSTTIERVGFVERERATALLEATIGETLLDFDRAFAGHGQSHFAILAEEVKRAVLGIEAARQALGGAAAEIEQA